MPTLPEYAKIILSLAEEEVLRTKEREDHNRQMAGNIFLCPKRNGGRTAKEILDVTRLGNALEFGLHQRLARVYSDTEKNMLEFDIDDPETYNWDVSQGGNFFECKTFAQTYFSYYPRTVRTMRRNLHKLDYVVCGKTEQYGDAWVVNFKLVADAKSFFTFEWPSGFNEGEFYYDHKRACPMKKAFLAGGI